jgi:hypothetical protein
MQIESKVSIEFGKLLGFRHLVRLADDPNCGKEQDRGDETTAMSRAAGALFAKGGEWKL